MGRINDLSSKRINKLEVLKLSDKKSGNKSFWWCKCDCGNTKEIRSDRLSGKDLAISCGCVTGYFEKTGPKENLIGNTYGQLKVLECIGTREDVESRAFFWKCQCSCGKIKEIRTDKLLEGSTVSCGCFSRFKEGEVSLNKTHGESKTYLYHLWIAIKGRCFNETNEAYKDYGERGIIMHPAWIYNFEAFRDYILNNLGERPKNYSLDRINVNGNYEPGNIRWLDDIGQANNKRNNHKLEFNGKIQGISEWARELNMDRLIISKRIKRGWSVERTLTTPKQVITEENEELITIGDINGNSIN